MGERLERVDVGGRCKQAFAIGATSLAAANLLGGCTTTGKSDSIYDLPPLTHMYDDEDHMRLRSIYTSVGNDNVLRPTMDTLPDVYSQAFKDSLSTPMLRLAVAEGTVNYVGVLESHRLPDPSARTDIGTDGYDNAQYRVLELDQRPGEPLTKQIEIWMSDGVMGHDSRIFINNWTLEMTVIHESVHALIDEWWKKFPDIETADPKLAAKIKSVQETCNPIGAWLYDETAKIVDTYLGNAKEDPKIIACAPVLGNLAGLFGNRQVMNLGEDTFECLDEGHMIKDKFNLPYTPPGGHIYDNLGELVASTVTVLSLNPDYIKRCLSTEDPHIAAMLKPYAKSALELTFHLNPEIESLLRKNPDTAEIIDFLMNS